MKIRSGLKEIYDRKLDLKEETLEYEKVFFE